MPLTTKKCISLSNQKCKIQPTLIKIEDLNIHVFNMIT